jgi:hypothetical protein
MPRRPPAPEETPRRRTRPAAPPAPTRAPRRPTVAVDPDGNIPQRGGFGGLLRGPGSVLGGLTAVDGASRSLDRLARSAERGADLLERAEREIGLDRIAALIDRADSVVTLLEGISESMAEIEAMVADLHEQLMPPKGPQRRR